MTTGSDYIEDDCVMEGPDIPPDQPLAIFLLTDKVWQFWSTVLQRKQPPTLEVRKLIATELANQAMPPKKGKRGRPPLTDLEKRRKMGRAIIVGKWVRDEQRADRGCTRDAAIESIVDSYQALSRAAATGTYVVLSVEGIEHLLKGN